MQGLGMAGGGFGTELIYSFIIIIASLMIYFGTRELYNLTSHKGIKYFRQAFLFFAIAYFFRSFIKSILIIFNVSAVREFTPLIFGPISLFLFMYSSSMAIFYLLYSVMYKKWNSNKIFWFHILAVLIALTSVLTKDLRVHVGMNIFLFLLVTLIVCLAYLESRTKTKEHKYNLFVIYQLLFIFWILNIIDILVPNFFRVFQLLLYLASIAIFLIVLYKVLKKTGAA